MLRNFPDVYVSVTDKSQVTPLRSRFRCGLIGPAEKGPINVGTKIGSSRDFLRIFGSSLPGKFLSNAVQLVSNLSDGATVVRIAHEYTILDTSGASATGTEGATVVDTPNYSAFQISDYIRVSQLGKVTTVNARVIGVTVGQLELDPATPLLDTYDAANIDRSRINPQDGDPSMAVNAANDAEAFMTYPVWDTDPLGGNSTTVAVSGAKSTFEVEVTANYDQLVGALNPGDTVKIEQSGLETSRELMVRELVPPLPGVNGKIKFEPVNRSEFGYQAVSLQDSYTDATVTLMLTENTVGYHLLAAMPGTWANSDGVRTGLIVKVVPGSRPDTKKLQIFEDSGLVEEIDNLSSTVTIVDEQSQLQVPNPNFFVNAVNGKSAYINFALNDPSDPTSCWLGVGDIEPPANTRKPWKASNSTVNQVAFSRGFNGENVIDADYIGTIDPVTELPTGLKIFEDKDLNLELDIICCPGISSMAVAQEMDRIGRAVNVAALLDIPKGLNLRQATNWSNGLGLYSSNGSLDTAYVTEIWNWGTTTDSFTGNSVVVPPTCGALRCLAYTFDSFGPGWAAAGETRGLIPEFTAVEYPRSSDEARQASYRDGNVVNSILVNQNRIMLFGNATTQRTDSKLASLNNLITVNTILRNMYKRGRKYLFDPLDDILLAQMYQDFRNLLSGYKNDRMIEDFDLTLDKTNNSPDDRNQRQAQVAFQVVPIDALEKLFIKATVRESGAVLNSLSGSA
jgi:hypothetical protein